jgi:hypothetical protein
MRFFAIIVCFLSTVSVYSQYTEEISKFDYSQNQKGWSKYLLKQGELLYPYITHTAFDSIKIFKLLTTEPAISAAILNSRFQTTINQIDEFKKMRDRGLEFPTIYYDSALSKRLNYVNWAMHNEFAKSYRHDRYKQDSSKGTNIIGRAEILQIMPQIHPRFREMLDTCFMLLDNIKQIRTAQQRFIYKSHVNLIIDSLNIEKMDARLDILHGPKMMYVPHDPGSAGYIYGEHPYASSSMQIMSMIHAIISHPDVKKILIEKYKIDESKFLEWKSHPNRRFGLIQMGHVEYDRHFKSGFLFSSSSETNEYMHGRLYYELFDREAMSRYADLPGEGVYTRYLPITNVNVLKAYIEMPLRQWVYEIRTYPAAYLHISNVLDKKNIYLNDEFFIKEFKEHAYDKFKFAAKIDKALVFAMETQYGYLGSIDHKSLIADTTTLYAEYDNTVLSHMGIGFHANHSLRIASARFNFRSDSLVDKEYTSYESYFYHFKDIIFGNIGNMTSIYALLLKYCESRIYLKDKFINFSAYSKENIISDFEKEYPNIKKIVETAKAYKPDGYGWSSDDINKTEAKPHITKIKNKTRSK